MPCHELRIIHQFEIPVVPLCGAIEDFNSCGDEQGDDIPNCWTDLATFWTYLLHSFLSGFFGG